MVKNYTAIDDLVKKYKRSLAVKTAISKPKEAELFTRKKEKYEIKEAVEHKAEEEVRPFVQARSETIELPPDLKKMGLQPASSTQFPSYQNIKLPLSDDKIVAGLHQPITSSLRWLATLLEYILGQAHLALKVIHGKVVRVIRT